MTLEQLQYICTIAHNSSLSAAADELFISQQALSKSVDKLEHELGYSLIFRTHKGISLTAEGNIFVKHAQKVLDQVNELYHLNTLTEEQNPIKKEISLVASSYFTRLASAKILSHFSKYYPHVRLSITESSNEDIIHSIMHDLSHPQLGFFATLTPSHLATTNIEGYCGIDFDKVTAKEVAKDSVVALCAASSFIAQRGYVEHKDLERFDLYTVFLHGIGSALEAFYQTKPNIIMSSRQFSDDIFENIIKNNAICLVPEQIARTLDYSPQLTLVPLADSLKVVHYFLFSNQYELTDVENALFKQTEKILNS